MKTAADRLRAYREANKRWPLPISDNPRLGVQGQRQMMVNHPNRRKLRMVPVADFLELYDAAHAVIDHIRLHVDHAEYEGGMNAVQDFREISARLLWKHADKIPDPLDNAGSDE